MQTSEGSVLTCSSVLLLTNILLRIECSHRKVAMVAFIYSLEMIYFNLNSIKSISLVLEPSRWPGFDPKSSHMGFWWKIWNFVGFSPNYLVSLVNYHSRIWLTFINHPSLSYIVSVLEVSLSYQLKK